MRAAEQWSALERELGDDWERARLAFVVEDGGALGAAAGLLGTIGAGRVGNELRFDLDRRGGGPDKLRNLLARLDRKRIWGSLRLVETERTAAVAAPSVSSAGVGLVAGWDTEIARLPAGWRDLLCELELDSSDYVARAALLGAPLNPTRVPDAIALRFRVASHGGYGAAAGMARRCLERMDAEGITGRVRILTALADTENVDTQGPVWRIAGRAV